MNKTTKTYTVKTARSIVGHTIHTIREQGRPAIRVTRDNVGQVVPEQIAFYLYCYDHSVYQDTAQIVPTLWPKHADNETRDLIAEAYRTPEAPNEVLRRQTFRNGKYWCYWTFKVEVESKDRVYSERTVDRCIGYAREAAFGYNDREPIEWKTNEFNGNLEAHEDSKTSEIYLWITKNGVTFSPSLPGDATYSVDLSYPFTREEAEKAANDCTAYADWYFQSECGCEDCGHGEGELGGWFLNPECKSCGGEGIS